MLVWVEMASASAEMRSELEKPKRKAEPMSRKPEEKAPSTKYLRADS